MALNLVKNKLLPNEHDPCGLIRFGSVPQTKKASRPAEWTISGPKHSIFGRYLDARLDTPTDYDGQNILTLTNGIQIQRAYSFVLGDTYLIGGDTVSSFRGAVNRTVSTTR